MNRWFRTLVPNIRVRIRHVERDCHLQVRLRQHLGLVARGTRAFEPRYVDALRMCTEKGNCVFDVGANIGFYSVLFARWVGPAGFVWAYEPDPENAELLERNVRENGCRNVQVRRVALSKTSGVMPFSQDRVTGCTGHLGEGLTYAEMAIGTGKKNSICVQTATLDDEVRTTGAKLDLLKLDIEGSEYDTLRGGAWTLREHRPLIVSEMSHWDAGEDGRRTQQSPAVLHLLREAAYSLWNLDTGKPVSIDAPPWMFLAVPIERKDEVRIARVLASFGGASR
jgi:FkbM family methyltransferase